MSRYRRNQQSTPKLDLKLIHQSISSSTCHEQLIQAIEKTKTIPNDDDNNTFENSLQAIETSARPTDVSSIEALRNTITHAIIQAKDEEQKWKLLLLTILRKRYHMKAPEAKSIQRDQEATANDRNGTNSTGHGERMSFYISFLTLYSLSNIRSQSQSSLPEQYEYITEYANKACHCLGRLAVSAGGTRDICALIEHLVYVSLIQNGIIDIHNTDGKKRAIVAATVQTLQSPSSPSSSSTVLDDLIQVVSELLDQDFQLIQTQKEDKPTPTGTGTLEEEKEEQTDLQSTINTFIPHHDRGTGVRKLTQSVAELMIWNTTTHSSKDSKFQDSVKTIISSSSTDDDDKVISSLHTIQTSIRRFRKVLNESSRNQGFSLCTSYAINPSSIKLSMVKRGREGDVTTLQKLASKKRDTKTMKLIAKRSDDPNKAIPMTSIRRFCNSWISLDAGEKQQDDDDDEMIELDLKIQEATIQATLKLLQKKVKWESRSDVVLASLDGKVESDVAAILIACALNPELEWDDDSKMKEEAVESKKVKLSLFIGEKEHTITSKEDAMSLLNEVCTRDNNVNTPATTKDIQNFIERHVETNSHLILMTSTDVKIEQRVLTDLQTNKNTIHCHMIDDFEYRMNREKAKVGDITITLAWDNECDLDLHCMCPNGDHISYSSKEGGGAIGGGYLDVDMNAGSPYSMEPVENIFFGDAEKGIEAAKGKYKVFVQNFSYHGDTVIQDDAIPWRVRVVKNGEIQEYTGSCTGSGSSSDATVVEFEYDGRKVPLPEKVGTAMDSSNLISVTSSTGDTIDSISGLLSVVTDHEELAVVEELVRSEPAEVIDDDNEDDDDIVMADAEETKVSDESDEAKTNAPILPLMADKKRFEITNRDRLYLNLSKLPKLFHSEVNQCFGSSVNLVEFTASNLARQLIQDKTPVEELKKAGYQEDIVSIVKEKMQTFGL